MRVGSLFSGIGGMDLGFERAGCNIAWQVEIDGYCRQVLGKHWPKVPQYGDIKTIDWTTTPPVDLVCGGFPCQPFSCAGKRAGQADDRYLWPEVVRCLSVLKPTWFLGENVAGLISLGLDQVLSDLEKLGYEARTFVVPACAVEAPHRRNRLWIVAYAERERSQGQRPQHRLRKDRKEIEIGGRSGWPPEPNVGRVAHGVSRRVDRLRGLGNSVVPQVVEVLARMTVDADKLGGNIR